MITDSENFDNPEIRGKHAETIPGKFRGKCCKPGTNFTFFYGIFASRENRKSEIHRVVKYAQQGCYKEHKILIENIPEVRTNIRSKSLASQKVPATDLRNTHVRV